MHLETSERETEYGSRSQFEPDIMILADGAGPAVIVTAQMHAKALFITIYSKWCLG